MSCNSLHVARTIFCEMRMNPGAVWKMIPVYEYPISLAAMNNEHLWQLKDDENDNVMRKNEHSATK